MYERVYALTGARTCTDVADIATANDFDGLTVAPSMFACEIDGTFAGTIEFFALLTLRWPGSSIRDLFIQPSTMLIEFLLKIHYCSSLNVIIRENRKILLVFFFFFK